MLTSRIASFCCFKNFNHAASSAWIHGATFIFSTITWNCPFVWQANLCSRSAAMGGHHSKATQGKQTDLNLIKAVYIHQLVVFVNMYLVMYIALHYSTREKRSKGHWSLPLFCLLLLRWYVVSMLRVYYIKNFNFFFKITSFLGNLLCFIINQYPFVLFYIFHHWRYWFSIKYKPLY